MVHLRHATPADLNLLRYWDTKPHVIQANPNDVYSAKTIVTYTGWIAATGSSGISMNNNYSTIKIIIHKET